MTILLTGFNSFGKITINPSQVIVQTIKERAQLARHDELVTEILPTEFKRAGNIVQELVRKIKPDLVMLLGVAPMSEGIKLERVALNLDDADLPDNVGELRSNRLIVQNGPMAYLSTLPLETMRNTLLNLGIPADISNHAGTYVCNHVFYTVLHQIEQIRSRAQCGLIHVPLMSEQLPTNDINSLTIAVLVKAIESCLKIAQENAAVSR